MRSRLRQVQWCYERALQRDRTLSGRVILHWTIGTDGRVAGMQVRENTTKDEGISGCIAQTVAGWQFPPPSGGTVEVDFPFRFDKAR